MRVVTRIKRWYEGELYIDPPDSLVVTLNHRVRSKSAVRTRKVVQWLQVNYQWLILAILAALALKSV